MILDAIIAHKQEELQRDQAQVPLTALKSKLADLPPTQNWKQAIAQPDRMQLIAEVKKKSPSKGIIRHDFDPVHIAQIYAENGAAAISVLTDTQFFAGSLEYLTAIREAVDLPLLRKDFIIDPYQIYQARVAGADAILLIVAVLSREQLLQFIDIAATLSMAALVEVHTADELEIALDIGAEIIGINNRDLRTFHTDLATTFDLRASIPTEKIVISESGIYTRAAVESLHAVGVHAILVGESLMRSADIGKQVRNLIGE